MSMNTTKPFIIIIFFFFENEPNLEIETKTVSAEIPSKFGGQSFPQDTLLKAVILCEKNQRKGGRGKGLKDSPISTYACFSQFRFT